MESKRQEDSLRRFRMKECNLLVSSSQLNVGVDNVRANLVIAFDSPTTFKQYASYKVKAKASKAHFLIFTNQEDHLRIESVLNQFAHTEAILKSYCTVPGICNSSKQTTTKLPSITEAATASSVVAIENKAGGVAEAAPPAPNDTRKFNPFYSINRYCSKLPSDTFTRLTPLFGIETQDCQEGSNCLQFVCQIILPINCPIRKAIKSVAPQASVEAAQYSAGKFRQEPII